MALMVLFGTAFIAFGLPLALFIFIVRKSAKLVIVFFSSAFVWLLSAMASAIIWQIISPLQKNDWFSILHAVALQETFRWLYWKLLKKAEIGLNALGEDGSGHISRDKIFLVAGLGYGVMSIVMQFSVVLNANTGPGTLPARGCSDYSLFAISALIASCIGALNILWSVIMYRGLEEKFTRGTRVGLADWKIFYTVATHYLAAYLTLSNEQRNSCAATLVPLYAVVVITGVVAWRVVGMRFVPYRSA